MAGRFPGSNAGSSHTARCHSTRHNNPVSTGVRDVVHEHDEANDPAPLAVGSINRGPAGGSSPEGRVTITFRAFQRGEWIVTDAISVDSANPVEAQAIAERYARAGGLSDTIARECWNCRACHRGRGRGVVARPG
jgi:hypothetical protein